tara:strand:+ start:354 stop:704 length:351 start_codon:yes stop_codon:yes gene_type:complete
MSDKKKKGLGVSGGYRANQEGIGGGGRVEYVIKNGKVTTVPYVSGSASKSFKEGKPRTSVDRMGFDAEYKPTKNSFIRAGASTDPRRKNKKALIEAGFTFKKGGMIIKDRQYLKGK